MNYSVQIPGKVIFEVGGFKKLPELVKEIGDKAFLVFGSKSFRESDNCKSLLSALKNAGISFKLSTPVTREPSPEIVDENTRLAKYFGANVVVAVGGGSVIDTAKAVSAMATNEGSVKEYLEGIGTKTVRNDPIPLIAVPTTAGTGSEATKNAVISSVSEGFKNSIRHDKMLPVIALIDAELMVSVPKSVTAPSGMDAICQLIEGYTTKIPNDFSDALALYNIKRALSAIRRAYNDPNDIEARETMACAATYSGMIIACAGLGAAHGVAAGLGAIYDVPHGIACAIMLPYIMEYNYQKGVSKYEDIAKSVLGKKDVYELISQIKKLNVDLNIPTDLKAYNIKQKDLKKLTDASLGFSTKKNPVTVNKKELMAILSKLI
ncbi:MAG: iron-containing alcohol dehydrogenase [Eubacteriales bacterium]